MRSQQEMQRMQAQSEEQRAVRSKLEHEMQSSRQRYEQELQGTRKKLEAIAQETERLKSDHRAMQPPQQQPAGQPHGMAMQMTQGTPPPIAAPLAAMPRPGQNAIEMKHAGDGPLVIHCEGGTVIINVGPDGKGMPQIQVRDSDSQLSCSSTV